MSEKAQAAVAEAKKIVIINDPMRYNPQQFDCSGFVQYCYKRVGVNLPRTTQDQINCGKAVSQKDLKIGDLVFPNTGHVGLYIGNGQMIHIPKTGYPTKVSNIVAFYTARRVA